MDMYFAAADKEEAAFQRPGLLLHGLDDVISNKASTFVKCITIRVTRDSVLSGKAAELLSQPCYSNAVFPSVAHLKLDISCGDGSEEGDDRALQNNANMFCECIKRLFPSYKALCINIGYLGLNDYYDIVGDAVTSLATNQLKAFDYSGNAHYLHMPDLGHLANLTHISFVASGGPVLIVELVRRNASTLVSADLRGLKFKASAELVTGPNNTIMSYPRLKKLSLSVTDKKNPKTFAIPDNGIPFPVLTHLRCAERYPFDSDILFRGNNATMESLDLFLSHELVQVIHKFDLLAPGSYPNLSSMVLKAWYRPFVDEKLLLRHVRIPFEIGPQVASVDVNCGGQKRDNIIVDAVRLSATPHSIRLLDIREFKLTMLEVINVIGMLPNLIHIKFCMVEDSQGGEQPPLDLSLLPKLHGDHGILPVHLRSLQFESLTYTPSRQTVANILIIASLLPSARFVTGIWLLLKGKEYIQEVLSEPAFAPHASKLRSLAYLEGMDIDSDMVSIS
ncbi:hypothetical protein GGI12_002244 [Dipsacomyces acuminosporus]|nr:hypothetical protein GGI12_002244 [Dipsacomyces acuminosporus]